MTARPLGYMFSVMKNTASNHIKKMRERRGLTKYRVALDSGIGQTHYASIEAGKIMPRLDTANRIAAALTCAVDDLWPRESA